MSNTVKRKKKQKTDLIGWDAEVLIGLFLDGNKGGQRGSEIAAIIWA